MSIEDTSRSIVSTNTILHLICKGRGNNTGVPTDLNGVDRFIYENHDYSEHPSWDGRTYQSGFWDFTLDEAKKLIGGSLFLHYQKKRPSTVGGMVVHVYEKEITDDNLKEIMDDYVGVDKPTKRKRVVFIFKRMDDLRDIGLKYYEIADLLNLKGIVSPTNKQYTAKLVERSLFKYKRRLKRENEIELVSVKEDYQIGIIE